MSGQNDHPVVGITRHRVDSVRLSYVIASIPNADKHTGRVFFSSEQPWGHKSSDLVDVFKTSRPRSRPLERRVFLFEDLRGCASSFGTRASSVLRTDPTLADLEASRSFVAERPMTDVQSGLEGGLVRF